MSIRKCVLLVSVIASRFSDLRSMMKDDYACVQLSLEKFTHGSVISVDGIVVDIDLKNSNAVEMLRQGLSHVDRSRVYLILTVDSDRQSDMAEAAAFGADEVIRRGSRSITGFQNAGEELPVTPFSASETTQEIVKKIKLLDANFTLRQQQPKMLQSAIASGDNAMSQIFDFARTGKLPKKDELQNESRSIIDALYEHGLDAWLNVVRSHHNATYQHCLIVTGVATAFGQSIGCNSKDIERLSVGAMLHDIGKSKIPIEILQKPGPLDETEWIVMKQHPDIGRSIMSGAENFDPEVLDVIAHHHEYLDGSGYPDRLSGSEISDIVRVMTISDIFGAMMERRSYKAEMSPTQAYEVLLSMHTKLEKPLVRAFGKILETFSSAA